MLYTIYEEAVETMLKDLADKDMGDREEGYVSILNAVMLSVENGVYKAEGYNISGDSSRRYSGKTPKELLENVKKGEQIK